MIPTPRAVRVPISANSCRFRDRSVRLAVGSSRISTERSERKALAISTICCSARLSRCTGRRGDSPKPRSVENAFAPRGAFSTGPEEAPAAMLGAEKQVLLDRHLRDEGELLEHRRDAARLASCTEELDPLAAHPDVARPTALWRRRAWRSASTCPHRSRRRARAPRPPGGRNRRRRGHARQGKSLVIPRVDRSGGGSPSSLHGTASSRFIRR